MYIAAALALRTRDRAETALSKTSSNHAHNSRCYGATTSNSKSKSSGFSLLKNFEKLSIFKNFQLQDWNFFHFHFHFEAEFHYFCESPRCKKILIFSCFFFAKTNKKLFFFRNLHLFRSRFTNYHDLRNPWLNIYNLFCPLKTQKPSDDGIISRYFCLQDRYDFSATILFKLIQDVRYCIAIFALREALAELENNSGHLIVMFLAIWGWLTALR